MCLRMATSAIYKMICENICVRLVFDNSSPTKWYLEIHNRTMTSTETPMLQNNMNWEHVSLQNHSRHSVYRLHKPLLSVVFILTTMNLKYIDHVWFWLLSNSDALVSTRGKISNLWPVSRCFSKTKKNVEGPTSVTRCFGEMWPDLLGRTSSSTAKELTWWGKLDSKWTWWILK